MKRPRARAGATLLESLLVLAVGAVILAGAAAHFRTLRQVGAATRSRREALQRARVALDRMARHIRQAKAIASITDASITVLDFEDTRHVFRLSGDELLYGVNVAEELLAEGIRTLQFQGLSGGGDAEPSNPGTIDAVAIRLAAAVPDSDESIELATCVRLRRQVGAGQVRVRTWYASTSFPTAGGGVSDPELAYGEPDEQYAHLASGAGGRFEGFDPQMDRQPVHRIAVGFRMRYATGSLRVTARLGRRSLREVTYEPQDLQGVQGEDAWWWIDITEERRRWSTDDVSRLSVEVEGPAGSGTDIPFDAFAVQALLDAPGETFVWADRTGDGSPCPSQWQSPDLATGSPDDARATGEWESEDWQAFRMPASASEDEIVAVYACVEGYIEMRRGRGRPMLRDGVLEVRAVEPDAGLDQGIPHGKTVRDLRDYIGSHREGLIAFDLSNDRAWTWDDLARLELRVHLVRDGSTGASLRADAVGWRVLTRAAAEKGVSQWTEP
ncbi:MAG: type II secretion system protein J [Candidatus Brocadiia bacterium]